MSITNKEICIEPYDGDMETQLVSLKILNEFKKMGFTKRDAFVEVVQSNAPELIGYKSGQRLEVFWSGRIKDPSLNNILNRVIAHLKHS